MKKNILIVTLIFNVFLVLGQIPKDNLYFIAGFPDIEYAPETSDLIEVSGMLTINNDSLNPVMLITDSLQRLNFLRSYPEYSIIIALSQKKENIYDINPILEHQFTIIHTKTLEKKVVDIPKEISYNDTIYSFYNQTFSNLFINDTLTFILKYSNFSHPNNIGRSGILYCTFNPYTELLQIVNPSIYKEAIANEGVLKFDNSYDGISLNVNPLSKILRIPTPNYYGNPIYCDYLPSYAKPYDEKKSKMHLGGAVMINNHSILALYLYERNQINKWINCRIHIYNKKTEKWDKLDLETSFVMAKNFEQYIVGNYRVKTTTLIDKDFKINPTYWQKNKTKYGPDYKNILIDLYSEGDLYMYNIENKQMITWNTGHGDSEILLVQDEVAYYRVNDKIYSVPIVNGKKIGKHTLLIQHDIVRDIHWAFISKK